MKLLKSILTLSTLFITIISYSQTEKVQDCKILKHSKLKYVENDDKTAFVVIKNNKHIEYLRNEKYYIKSDLVWINECEYNATMTEITLPNFPFKAGEVMNVKFEKIENGIVTGIGTVRGNSFPVKFELIN
ncbi:hypothetical protein [Flavobacterium sp. N2270]|uniref:hypothetical protein n=1 Tax=Flavobacterium sp. N2270 TaxID=2986831 RepID=UPI002224CF47|nr:hypothetical protein [Flavobacterium sp. N2270]